MKDGVSIKVFFFLNEHNKMKNSSATTYTSRVRGLFEGTWHGAFSSSSWFHWKQISRRTVLMNIQKKLSRKPITDDFLIVPGGAEK